AARRLEDLVHKRGFAFDIAIRSHLCALEVSLFVPLLAPAYDLDLAARLLPLVFFGREIPSAARHGLLWPDRDCLRLLDALTRLDYARTGAADVRRLRREQVPVRHNHLASAEIGHQVERNQIARAIQARIAALRIEFGEPVSDRHVRADGQDGVR